MTLGPDNRLKILTIAIAIVFIILAARLFHIQIINDKYKINADNNALKYETKYPVRGRIIDRNGEVIVENKLIYDIVVTPIEVQPFDTSAFCAIFDVDEETIKSKFAEYRLYRKKIGYGSRTLIKQVSGEQYNRFVEQAYKYPGIEAILRSSRTYPYNAGGNLIGYVSEVDQAYMEKHPEYRSGDDAGRTGMEQAYESRLRGEKGYSIYLRDAHNRIQERYENGEYDKEPIAGEDVHTTIDIVLQEYGERLMKNKVGSLVAIEPSTGEILTMISSPGIDITQLSEINKYYNDLISDPLRPMFNRAVQSAQPPGSVFKLVNGLIGLQEGTLSTSTQYPCHKGYIVGKFRLGCHNHPSPINFYQSIMMSCNAYYCYVLRNILDNPKYGSVAEGMDAWREYVMSFGFGQKLGSDVPYEMAGSIPSSKMYDRWYGKKRWHSLTVVSLSIGQGEIQCTPLHMANFVSTIANRGYYYIPHIEKSTERHQIDEKYFVKQYTKVDTAYFSEVVKGMSMAVSGGPGSTASVAGIPGVEVCGKTGTAQNPHGDDHSVFVCFAPKDNPKIAVAAYIENGGFGATWAAPIASLLVEKYLHGEICEQRKYLEDRVMQGNLLYKVKVNKKK